MAAKSRQARSSVKLINMIQDNPGEPPLVSPTRDPAYLAELGFDGDVVLNALAGCGLDQYDPELAPEGSEEYKLTMIHRQRIASRVKAIAAAGLSPFLYTDIPTIPRGGLKLYPEELIHEGGSQRLCLRSKRLWEMVAAQLQEAFRRYPQAKGCFVRFGENYARFDTPHMIGNGIIHEDCNCVHCDSLSLVERYQYAIGQLCDIVIGQLDKILVLRTWDFGLEGFHARPATYRAVTDAIAPHEKLYFSIKWTRLDFRRYQPRNATLGIGRHGQFVEIQLAREYEGKGAFPNWLGSLWLREFPEVVEGRAIIRRRGEQPPFPDTPERMPLEEGVLNGIFAWTRGGGWGGPYLKYHDWVDINSFAMGKLAADPEGFDAAEAVRQWCRKEYGWLEDSPATATMLSVLEDSQNAVLKMFYCYEYANRSGSKWDCASLLWFRDDHLINNLDGLDSILTWAIENDRQAHILDEKAEAVRIWQHMFQKISQIKHDFEDLKHGSALAASIEAAVLLAKAIAALWHVRVRWLESGKPPYPQTKPIQELWQEFRDWWLAYGAFEDSGAGTLIHTGWQYHLLAEAFEPASEHFPSSPRPIYLNENNEVCIG